MQVQIQIQIHYIKGSNTDSIVLQSASQPVRKFTMMRTCPASTLQPGFQTPNGHLQPSALATSNMQEKCSNKSMSALGSYPDSQPETHIHLKTCQTHLAVHHLCLFEWLFSLNRKGCLPVLQLILDASKSLCTHLVLLCQSISMTMERVLFFPPFS